MKQSPLTQARRRIVRLENCLREVLRWCSDQHIALNAHGADTDDCDQYRELCRLRNRVWRTLPPNAPYGLNIKSKPQ